MTVEADTRAGALFEYRALPRGRSRAGAHPPRSSLSRTLTWSGGPFNSDKQ